ncbi:MAG: hypothetical protein GX557_04365 [Chloroflexi bacterium]|nr:hypothetical protein [Chloroflexota bacterium]
MRRSICLLALAAALFVAVGCGGTPEPPPDEALAVLGNVRSGYNAEDMALFCADFDDVMFDAGHTPETYLQTTQQLKAQLGAWESDEYLGAEDNEYTWRVTFAKSKAKLLLVLNEDRRVIGLWFR